MENLKIFIGSIIFFVLAIFLGFWAEKWRHKGSLQRKGSLIYSIIIAIIVSPIRVFAMIGWVNILTILPLVPLVWDIYIGRKKFMLYLNNTWEYTFIKNGFTQIVEIFKKNNINSFDTILTLKDCDLKQVGIEGKEERKNLLKFIKIYRAGKIEFGNVPNISFFKSKNETNESGPFGKQD
jgi:hypothetical protein